jgi:hypothetical protein
MMYLLQTEEVLYKLDRRMSIAVLGHLYGGNKSTTSFMKKYVITRGSNKASDSVQNLYCKSL